MLTQLVPEIPLVNASRLLATSATALFLCSSVSAALASMEDRLAAALAFCALCSMPGSPAAVASAPRSAHSSPDAVALSSAARQLASVSRVVTSALATEKLGSEVQPSAVALDMASRSGAAVADAACSAAQPSPGTGKH